MEEKTLERQAAPAAAEKVAEGKKAKKARLPGRKKRHPVRWIVLLLLLAGAGWGASQYLGRQQAPAVSNYQLAKAERREIGVSVSGSATLKPADSYQVSTLVSGEILQAPFEELSDVQKDDLLYVIDASTAQTSVASAALTVQEREIAYQHILDSMSPVSPVDGTVTEVYVRDGDSVAAGDKLAKIITSTDVTADFLFQYVDPSEFSVGQRADVFVYGYEGSMEGSVVSVSDGTALTANGKLACSVRVKIVNPGALTDNKSYFAQAVVGSHTSGNRATLNMSGSAYALAEAAGTVSGFNKLVGSTAAKGEVLCTISSQALDNQLQEAELAIQSAKMQAGSAQDSLENYRITSPISGTVIEKSFKAGDKVSGADSGTLAEIYDLSSLKMEMDVNELDIGKIAVGQTVELTAAALPGESFMGTVDKVGVAGKTVNGFTTYPVTVVVKEYGALRPGMNVSATILCETVPDALCVPVDAVARGNTVLVPGAGALSEDESVVADESLLESRDVVLGRSDGGFVEITSGLREGDTVAYLAAQAALEG